MKHQIFTIGKNEKTTLTTYILDQPYSPQKKPFVIVCPGGGFLDCTPTEGECVALKFNSNDFHAAVLVYSTAASASGQSHFPKPLLDLAEAVSIVRSHAGEWNVDENKIILLGFSAGGNLCALYENYWNSSLLSQAGTPELRKPNAAVLCYPLTDGKLNREEIKKQIGESVDADLEKITGQKGQMLIREFWQKVLTAQYGTKEPLEEDIMKASPIEHINADTPPTFLWTTFADNVLSPAHSLDYARKLYKAGITCELHVYTDGGHGLSLADETSAKKDAEIDAHIATWFPLAVQWIKKIL